MIRFPNIAEHIPEGRHGKAAVIHFSVTPEEAARLRTNFRGGDCEAGHYARLEINGALIMSDTPYERDTNIEVVEHARGDVLIFGLGLGMILPPILERSSVTSVTVVERERDVIRLIAPHYRDPRLQIIAGDAFKWQPKPRHRYDLIYFDIWGDFGSHLVPEMQALHRRAAKWRRPRAWVSSWQFSDLKNGWI